MAGTGLLAALVWITTSAVVCSEHQLSSTSVSSLLELAGFAAPCVSRALAQCHHDSNPPEETVPAIHNLTQEIQRLGSTIHSLQSAAEALPLQTLAQTLQNLSQSLPTKSEPLRPRHCRDLQDSGDAGRGVRLIFPYACCPHWGVKVFCDQDTDEGGWTVVQRRDDLPPYEDFYRTWVEYQRGFGELSGQFWLGLDTLHHLTSHSLQELRIDMADFDNATRWAKYGFFHVGDSDAKYIMRCGRYSGDAGDSLSGHSGHKFSTHDQDNDIYDGNCAKGFKGAWWYTNCHGSNLNGKYLKGTTESYADGVVWAAWRGHHYSLRQVEMKVRPSVQG